MTSTQDRPRVVFPKDWTFDLDNDMVDQLKDEFAPDDTVEELARKLEDHSGSEAQKLAEAFFDDYGKRWMNRTLELGDRYRDRTYETLLAAAESTGELAFPLVPERFIEIAYLSTQSIYSLPIVENFRHKFSFRMVFCDTISALRDTCGDELADGLPCRRGCLAAVECAFTGNGFDVEVSQDASIIDGEYCQFSVVRRDA